MRRKIDEKARESHFSSEFQIVDRIDHWDPCCIHRYEDFIVGLGEVSVNDRSVINSISVDDNVSLKRARELMRKYDTCDCVIMEDEVESVSRLKYINKSFIVKITSGGSFAPKPSQIKNSDSWCWSLRNTCSCCKIVRKRKWEKAASLELILSHGGPDSIFVGERDFHRFISTFDAPRRSDMQ